jgi:hypothetical protein
VQDDVANLVDSVGREPGDPTIERLQQGFAQLARLRREVAERFDAVRIDIQRMEQAVPARDAVLTHVPASGSQDPTWHESVGKQVMGFAPTHAPAWHVAHWVLPEVKRPSPVLCEVVSAPALPER